MTDGVVITTELRNNEAAATTTSQNDRLNEEKPSLCICILNFGTFFGRTLYNKMHEGQWGEVAF